MLKVHPSDIIRLVASRLPTRRDQRFDPTRNNQTKNARPRLREISHLNAFATKADAVARQMGRCEIREIVREIMRTQDSIAKREPVMFAQAVPSRTGGRIVTLAREN
jgi:hypothetical protein